MRQALVTFAIGVSFLLPQKVFATVVINEFQVEPSGSSQWVEIFNTGPDSQDISGWFVDDNGGTEKYTIPSNTILGVNNCISFSSGNFHWNTSTEDSARLLNGTAVVDEYLYSGSSGNGVSFGRSTDGTGSFITFSSPTRDQFNVNGSPCLAPPTPTPTPTPTLTPTPTPLPTATPSPTNTPTPTSTPVPTATRTPTSTPTKTPTQVTTKSLTPTLAISKTGSVLAGSTAAGNILDTQSIHDDPQEASPGAQQKNGLKPLIIAFLFIGAGLALIALVLVWQKRNLAKRVY